LAAGAAQVSSDEIDPIGVSTKHGVQGPRPDLGIGSELVGHLCMEVKRGGTMSSKFHYIVDGSTHITDGEEQTLQILELVLSHREQTSCPS
jgi:hypothetical protein